MTPSYVSDVFRRRGFDAAMKLALASQQQDLVLGVMLLNFQKTGVAKPVTVYKTVGRRVVSAGSVEGAKPEDLAVVKELVARRAQSLASNVARIIPTAAAPSGPKIPRGYTAKEWERRMAAARAA